MCEVKTSLPLKHSLFPTTSYLDLIKSKGWGRGGRGGEGGAVGKETSISVFVPYLSLLILMCSVNFGHHLQHFSNIRF